MNTSTRLRASRRLLSLVTLPLLVGACAVGAADDGSEGTGKVSSGMITPPPGPYGVAATPASFDFGLLRWKDQRHASMTFTAPEAEDLYASFAETYDVWRVDTVTRQGGMFAEDHASVTGNAMLHVYGGDTVTVDFTLDAEWCGGLDTTLWVKGDKWLAKAPVRATATWVGDRAAVSAYLTMDTEPPYGVGQTGLGPYWQTKFTVHLVNVGTESATVTFAPLTIPAGVMLWPGAPETLLPGESRDVRLTTTPSGAPRIAQTDAPFAMRVHTPTYDWDFSFPLQVYPTPARCGHVGEPIGPDGCCAGAEKNPFNGMCETPDDPGCGGLAQLPADRCCRHQQACRPCSGSACSPTNQPQCVHDGPKADDFYCELRTIPRAPLCKTGSPVYVECHVDCDHSGNVTYGWACSVDEAKKATEDANDGCEVECLSYGVVSTKSLPVPTVPPTTKGISLY